MPFRVGDRVRKRGRIRYSGASRRSTGRVTATQYRPSALTGEKLFLDKVVAAAAIDTTHLITTLNLMDVGSAVGQRNGRRAEMVSVYIRYCIQLGATETTSTVRLLLIYDKQANGAAITAPDVLDANTPEAMLNMDNRERFDILWDKTFGMNITAADSGSGPNQHHVFLKKFVKLRNREIIFSGTGGGIADIATGALYLMSLSTEAVGATAPVGNFVTRLRYRS